MSLRKLPPTRVLSKAWQELGRDDVVKIEAFPVQDGEVLRLVIESQNAECRQGVWLTTDQGIVIDGQQYQTAEIWATDGESAIHFLCNTADGVLHLYNIWERGGAADSQAWTSGMLVEDIPTGRRYRCNDIGEESNFDRLAFRIERIAVEVAKGEKSRKQSRRR